MYNRIVYSTKLVVVVDGGGGGSGNIGGAGK